MKSAGFHLAMKSAVFHGHEICRISCICQMSQGPMVLFFQTRKENFQLNIRHPFRVSKCKKFMIYILVWNLGKINDIREYLFLLYRGVCHHARPVVFQQPRYPTVYRWEPTQLTMNPKELK